MSEEKQQNNRIRDLAILTKISEQILDGIDEIKNLFQKDENKCKSCNLAWFQKLVYLIVGSLITGIGYIGVKYLEFVFKK